MLYEERRIRLKSGGFPAYRKWALAELWPALAAAGHRPLCVLNGLIGLGVEDVLLIVGFADFEARQAVQPLLAGSGQGQPPRDLMESEEVHLLLASLPP